MQKTIQRYVMDNWEGLMPGSQRPAGLSTLQISKSHGKLYGRGRILHLLMPDGADRPAVVAKFCRDKAYEGSLAREAELARELGQTAAGPGLPRVLGTPTLGGRLVVLEEAVGGVPMPVLAKNAYHSMPREDFESLVAGHFDKAAAFLKSLRAAAEPGAGTESGGTLQDDINAVVKRYAVMLDIRGTELHYLYGLGHSAGELLEGKAQAGMVHGDFTPFNVFLSDDGGMKVIDWEFAAWGRLGFLDTMRFIFYYFHELSAVGALGDDAFFETFIKPSGWFYARSLEFAAETEGDAVRDGEDFRTLLSLFMVFEAGLQMEVVGGAGLLDSESHKSAINMFTGYSFQREREHLLSHVTALTKDKAALEEHARELVEHIRGLESNLEKTRESYSSSMSWRLTYPLRYVSGMLKGTKPEN